VIHPIKKDSTVLIGRITGDYEWAQNAPSFRHRRAVEWLVDQPIPRIEFSEAARFEIGSALTMFKVKNHSDEFLARIGLAPSSPEFAAGTIPDDEVLADSEDALSAVRIQQDTSDFILARLLQAFSPREFEFFVSDLLNAAGYTARATQESGDGGIDVIAHRDPLGLEPPVIKVQVKRTTAPIGGPAVQQLTGALASGSNELGLFVTLGGFTKDAVHIERQRQDLRLVDGPALVEMLLDNYDRLPANIRTKIPLTRVFAVDREALSVS
ncbi:MAG: restriction endonuclease, partial [Actinomycetes bacterium]